jgi:hypothetical protein
MIHPITTVITPAKSRDLTTLATAKDELQISGASYDKRLKRWITEESAAIERYCGRRLVSETLQQVFRFHHQGMGHHSTDLRLTLWPVTEVISVTWGETVLTPDQWLLDGEAGLLRRWDDASGCWMPWFDYLSWYDPYSADVTVQYIGGYTLGVDLPPDIEAAALMQLQHRKTAGSRDSTIRSESVPNVLTVTYATPTGSEGNGAIVPAAACRLEPHREQRI